MRAQTIDFRCDGERKLYRLFGLTTLFSMSPVSSCSSEGESSSTSASSSNSRRFVGRVGASEERTRSRSRSPLKPIQRVSRDHHDDSPDTSRKNDNPSVRRKERPCSSRLSQREGTSSRARGRVGRERKSPASQDYDGLPGISVSVVPMSGRKQDDATLVSQIISSQCEVAERLKSPLAALAIYREALEEVASDLHQISEKWDSADSKKTRCVAVNELRDRLESLSDLMITQYSFLDRYSRPSQQYVELLKKEESSLPTSEGGRKAHCLTIEDVGRKFREFVSKPNGNTMTTTDYATRYEDLKETVDYALKLAAKDKSTASLLLLIAVHALPYDQWAERFYNHEVPSNVVEWVDLETKIRDMISEYAISSPMDYFLDTSDRVLKGQEEEISRFQITQLFKLWHLLYQEFGLIKISTDTSPELMSAIDEMKMMNALLAMGFAAYTPASMVEAAEILWNFMKHLSAERTRIFLGNFEILEDE